MYNPFILVALVALTSALPSPQLIDLVAIEEYPDAVRVTAPIDIVKDVVPSVPAAPIRPLTSIISSSKRDLMVEKRDGDCSPYPTGSGPVPSPDTVDAFESFPTFAAMATAAPTPDGYEVVFINSNASLTASDYMGLYTLTTYDTLGCASQCDQASGCQAFNMYIERDPSLNASADNCPNPPSTTNYKCTLWGAPVSVEEATNSGQYQDSFQVVIAGSNAYNKDAPPPACDGYNGPTELGGAINAPPSSGSYMGYQYFPFSQSQGYDPQTCADACNAQTTYDSENLAADGSYMACIFFNAYVLSEDGIPQGLYCSMYNETWDASYGTNYGQYQGDDRYTVSRSYSYALIDQPDSSAPLNVSSSAAPSAAPSAVTSAAAVSSSVASSSVASPSVIWSSVASSTAVSSTAAYAATASSTAASSTVVSSATTSSTTTISTAASSTIVSSRAASPITTSSAVKPSTATSSPSPSSTTKSSTTPSASSKTPSTTTASTKPASSTTTTSSTCSASALACPTFKPSLPSWSITNILGATTYGLQSPGSTLKSGTASASDTSAFYASLLPSSGSSSAASLTLSQSLTLCPGTNYTVNIDYAFANLGGGQCSLNATYPNTLASGRSVSVPMAVAQGQLGGWATTGWKFQAPAVGGSGSAALGFVFGCSQGGLHLIYLDDVRVAVWKGDAY